MLVFNTENLCQISVILKKENFEKFYNCLKVTKSDFHFYDFKNIEEKSMDGREKLRPT